MFTLLMLLVGCGDKAVGPGTSADSGDSGVSADVDLVAPVPAGQARAAVVTDPAALPGGIAAEGRPGDLMLKNDRVRFVVQAARLGHNYIGPGGGIIDADVVRADGEPGRDVIDEHTTMAGVARILEAESVTVIADGTDGGPAIVRAEGPVAPLALLLGAVESDSLLPTPDMWASTDYVLEPDTPLLRIETTVTWESSSSMPMEPGELMLVSYDATRIWRPGAGFDDDLDPDDDWVAAVGTEGDVAVALFPEGDGFADSPLQDLLEEVGQIMVGLYPSRTLAEGESATHRSWIGVGRDLASLTAARAAVDAAATDELGGSVVDQAGAPVAGARVHLLDGDGKPRTMALTDTDGRWAASVPAGSVASAIATGQGDGRWWDYARGAAFRGPYATEALQDEALATLTDGGGRALAEGQGTSDTVVAGSDIVLTLPTAGQVELTTADGLPAQVRLAFAAGDPGAAARSYEPGRPDGYAAIAYLGAGSLSVTLPPGEYRLLAHRGPRFGIVEQDVTVVAGETTAVAIDLPEQWSVEGLLAADPHMHASPSNDAEITMEQRLLTAAAAGLDLHFGTDHDHVADYRPLLPALGLDGVLGSVVADEVSPPSRGHFNTYPLEEDKDAQSHGTVRWWDEWRELGSTEGLFTAIRDRMHDDAGGIIQANHPLEGSGGLVSAADYDRATGEIRDGNKWSFDFDAIEVMNSGGYSDTFPLYLDMVARGLWPTPVGVSDAHGPDGKVGNSFTWVDAGTDVAGFTPSVLRDTWARRATIVSTGPMILATVDGAWAPGGTFTGAVELDVTVLAADWMPVDTLEVYRDGELWQRWTGDGDAPEPVHESISLPTDADAVYVVVARGDGSMAPITSRQPWAMASAIRVDVDGDGWQSPWPSITVR